MLKPSPNIPSCPPQTSLAALSPLPHSNSSCRYSVEVPLYFEPYPEIRMQLVNQIACSIDVSFCELMLLLLKWQVELKDFQKRPDVGGAHIYDNAHGP